MRERKKEGVEVRIEWGSQWELFVIQKGLSIKEEGTGKGHGWYPRGGLIGVRVKVGEGSWLNMGSESQLCFGSWCEHGSRSAWRLELGMEVRVRPNQVKFRVVMTRG